MTNQIIGIPKRIKYNSFSLVLIFFLYSLTTLPGMFYNQGLLTALLAVVLVFPAILINIVQKSISFDTFKALFVEFFILIVLLIEKEVFYNYAGAINETILYLLSIGTIGLMVGSFEYDENCCYRYGRILAYICFVTSVMALLYKQGSFLYSMRFGYALLPSALWFLYEYIKKKYIVDLVFFGVSLVLLLAWGSRGTILVILLFGILYMLKVQRRWLLFFLLTGAVLLPFLRDFLFLVLRLIAQYTGAKKIQGFISLFEEDGWSHSSGRDLLYEHCIDIIENNFGGAGVGFWQYDPIMNGLYPHNLFLHVGTEFGIIGIVLVVVILMIAIKKLFYQSSDVFLFYNYIFSIAIGRLMVSSMYWARPEFWVIIGLFICNSKLGIRKSHILKK